MTVSVTKIPEPNTARNRTSTFLIQANPLPLLNVALRHENEFPENDKSPTHQPIGLACCNESAWPPQRLPPQSAGY